MANPNPKAGPGRPKGAGNKTPLLMQELERVIFELPKSERIKRLRDFRDFVRAKEMFVDGEGNVRMVYANYVKMHIEVAKRQAETDQMDLYDWQEEREMIAESERQAQHKISGISSEVTH